MPNRQVREPTPKSWHLVFVISFVSTRAPVTHALPVTPRDTTGAGDAFTGAFLAALLAGADPGRAAEDGCRAGAAAVERVGARPPARD